MSELGDSNMVAATKSVNEMMKRSVNKRMLLSVAYQLCAMPYYANKYIFVCHYRCLKCSQAIKDH